MPTRQIRRLLSSALALVAVGCAWYYLAPTSLGGSATYVVTHGVSMEPHFHTGDLAVVRSQSSYHVGEIVAYNNKMLGTVVLHRIVGVEGGRYLFKGDNNDFVDFEHPLRSQLIGALWLHLPGAGATLQSIRSPALIGVLMALGFLLLSGAAFTRRRRRGRHRRAGESPPPAPARITQSRITQSRMTQSLRPAAGAVALAALALLPFLLLALLAFTRAPTARTPYRISYKQSGTLSYTAEATPGPIYPNDRAVTGEPLFTRVVDEVDVSFSYAFATAAAHSVAGKAWLSATLYASNGWHTTFALGPQTPFRGDRALASGVLDLSSVLALMRRVALATGMSSSSYELTLVPHVTVGGTVVSAPLQTTFSPKFQFALSALEVQPTTAKGGGAAGGEAPSTSAFSPSASGSVSGERDQPAYLSFGFARLGVAAARELALGGIAAILCLAAAALALARPRERGEAETIRARYGHLIVPVSRVWQLPGVPVIDVEDMDALARIAEHYDRSILHEAGGAVDVFWVADESGQFRYAVGRAASATAGAHERAPEPAAVAPPGAPEEPVTAVHQALGAPPEPAPQPAPGVQTALEPPHQPAYAAEEVHADEFELGAVLRLGGTLLG